MWPLAKRKPHRSTVLLTLGRLPVALEIARCLDAVGFRVVVADPFRWHLCRASRSVAKSFQVTAPNEDSGAFLRELSDIIDREDVQLVIPVSEEALYVAELKEQLEGRVRVLCEKPGTLHTFHDKLKFARMAKTLGLSAPDTFPERSSEAVQLMESDDYVVKPAHSCAGIGVQLCRNGIRHDGSGESMLVQRYIEGDHISSLSLLNKGREIVTVLYRGKVRAGTLAVCYERVDYAPAVHDWIRQFCKKVPFSGFIAFDFIVDGQGTPWAIECNPRASSGLHFLDMRDLARGLVKPGATRGIETRPERQLQWATPTLMQVLAVAFKPSKYKRRLRAFINSRDVVWSSADPWPSLILIPAFWETILPAIRSGISLGEAFYQDIAWFSPSSEPLTAMRQTSPEKLPVTENEKRADPENPQHFGHHSELSQPTRKEAATG